MWKDKYERIIRNFARLVEMEEAGYSVTRRIQALDRQLVECEAALGRTRVVSICRKLAQRSNNATIRKLAHVGE